VTFEISVRKVGEVSILDLHGSVVLYSTPTLRATGRSLVEAGEKKLLVNLGDVPYIDSGGVGAVVELFQQVRQVGGVLKMYCPSRSVTEVFKLNRMGQFILSKGNSEEQAINEINSILSVTLRCTCPLYSCNGWAPLQTLDENELKCVRCKCNFTISHPVGSQKQASVRIVWLLKDYVQDDMGTCVSLLYGPPFVIQLVGRLDLFPFNFLKKAWLGIRPPRKAIFDLSQATHISDKGSQALLDLFSSIGQDKAAILSEGRSRVDIQAFPPGSPIYEDRPSAVASLGDVSSIPPWIVEISPIKPSERLQI
jgi:anti-sigma B factor antagonist